MRSDIHRTVAQHLVHYTFLGISGSLTRRAADKKVGRLHKHVSIM